MSHADQRYDLATAACDLAPWQGTPRRSLVICSHLRSGTTLLGEILYRIGGLGVPIEYFHAGFRPHLQQRWSASGLDAYLRAVHKWRTDPSGLFSVKLFWRDVEELEQERHPQARGLGGHPLGSLKDADYRTLWSRVADLFPNPVFVHLRRQDRVRQAVSAMMAEQTKLWRSIPGVGRQEPVAPAQYDHDRIARLMALSDYCHGHWTRLFAALDVHPHFMTYESLIADPARELASLCDFLGTPRAPLPDLRMRRQSGAGSEEMVLRFLREEAGKSIPASVL